MLQFKLSLAVSTSVDGKNSTFQYLGIFTWGKHSATSKDLTLSPKEEEFAASLFEHSATYLLALQIDTGLENTIPARLEHADDQIRSAASIARLLRNSFAHNPFAPTWLIDRRMKNKTFEVKDIIRLDTAGLSNRFVDKWEYGGPLALLQLAKYSIKLIEKT